MHGPQASKPRDLVGNIRIALDEMLAALTPTGLYLYIMIQDLAEIGPLRGVLGM